MALSSRNQDLYKAVLSLITGQIKSSPRQDSFRRFTKEPVKLSGIGKVTVPEVVWESLKDAEALTTEWRVTIDGEYGTSPEFTINRR